METETTKTRPLPGPVTLVCAWFLLFGLTLLLYSPFLEAPYFTDDLLFYHPIPPPHLFDFFWMRSPFIAAYRPAEAMILTFIQMRFGLNTMPIHLVSMAAHASLCLMVWIAALRLAFRPFEALFACALMLVTQVGAPALLGNDTMSQATSAALGGAACLLLGFACRDSLENGARSLSKWLLISSALLYCASLFMKETSAGLIIVITLFLCLVAFQKEWSSDGAYFVLRSLIPYGILMCIYFAFRLHAGLRMPTSGLYRVTLGTNVFKNLAQFGLIAISPISSVTMALAIHDRRLILLGLIALSLVLVAITLFTGIRSVSGRKLSTLLLICTVAAVFPAFILQHISELYFYNAYPYFALLAALALGSLASRGLALRSVMVACSAMLLAGQVFATRQKASLMNNNGIAAARLLASISQYMQGLPEGSEIWLIGGESSGPKYSVFVLNGLDVLEIGESNIGPVLGRPDILVRFVSNESLLGLRPDIHRLILELRNGVLTPVGIPTQSSVPR
jgi:hypothetical protein